jgi:hypothetical protein
MASALANQWYQAKALCENQRHIAASGNNSQRLFNGSQRNTNAIAGSANSASIWRETGWQR